jgi:hypothetical protein
MEYILLWLGACLVIDIIWYLVHGAWPYGGQTSKRK